jgi:hypothetical protein
MRDEQASSERALPVVCRSGARLSPDPSPLGKEQALPVKIVALAIVVLATALPALASPGKTLRVDRPERGAGAKVTSVHVVKGVVPHRMRALVLTDIRCTPDAQGMSHCLNRMRLADGTVVTVQHDHRMMDMPCLSPGEHVTLTPR